MDRGTRATLALVLCRRSFAGLVQVRVQRRVIIHLELAICPVSFSAGENIVQKMLQR